MKTLIKLLFIYIIYCFIIHVIYHFIDNQYVIFQIKFPSALDLFEACLIAPLWEEAVYRWAPIEICKQLEDRLNIEITIPVCIAISLLFGYGHYENPQSVLIQGVFGLFSCYLYLKTSSYWKCVIFHATWNFLTCSLLY